MKEFLIFVAVLSFLFPSHDLHGVILLILFLGFMALVVTLKINRY